MKAGIAQINCYLGEVEENSYKIDQFIERAKDEGCDAVMFPELSDTEYDAAAIAQTASAWDGLPLRTIRGAAKDLGIQVVCGLSEKEDNRIYNSLAVVDSNGTIAGSYRKTHLFHFESFQEGRIFTPGDSLATAEVQGMRWGLMICYDLRFPEMARSLCLTGAEVLVVCAAWPDTRINHWETLVRARAIENQAYVIAVNRCGTDGNVTFGGSSCIVSPSGEILASAPKDKERLLTAELHLDKVKSLREKMPVFKHRRQELY